MSCGNSTIESGPEDEANTEITTFSDLYYFEANKESRYEEFAAKKTKRSISDIVWMVNAGLDNKPYDDPVEAAAPASLTVLVGKHISIPENYEPDDLVEIDITTLRKEAADAFASMRDDAEGEGLTLVAQSGYRSYDRQKTIYENYRLTDPEGADTYSSRPGYSEHQTGLALDVNFAVVGNEDFVGTPEAKWVAKNCYKYGFIVRYTEKNKKYTEYMPEPWHLRYIGIENAKLMKDEKIKSYEEFWVKFVAHRPK